MAEVIVAFDVAHMHDAYKLWDRLQGRVAMIKLNHLLMLDPGWQGFKREMINSGCHLMVDLKLADIPSTVQRVTEKLMYEFEGALWGLTVRQYPMAASAGIENVDWQTRDDPTRVILVPELTSQLQNGVPMLDHLSDVDAVVVSGQNALRTKEAYPYTEVICPGFRLPGDAQNDHLNTVLPVGADYVVVGRPIITAEDPLAAFERYQEAAYKL